MAIDPQARRRPQSAERRAESGAATPAPLPGWSPGAGDCPPAARAQHPRPDEPLSPSTVHRPPSPVPSLGRPSRRALLRWLGTGVVALTGLGSLGCSEGVASPPADPARTGAADGSTRTARLAVERLDAAADEPAVPAAAGGAAVAGGAPEAAPAVSVRQRLARVFYSPDYTLARHSFETTRKAGWVAESLARNPLAEVEVVAPEPLAEAALLALHQARYVAAIRTGRPLDLAQSQGFTWDAGLWTMVLASNGGAVAAALAALEAGVAGSLSCGLHHAAFDRGRGFCTFNGLALAARAAVAASAERVLILDLDAHCGGGTHSLIRNDPAIWHADVAVNVFDSYTPGPRHTLDLVTTAGAYLPTIEARLTALAERGPGFDLCLYNAGMDPHQHCPVGGLRGIDGAILAARERLVFDWCRDQRLPVAFVLAGGYTGPQLDERAVVALHRLTLEAAAAIS